MRWKYAVLVALGIFAAPLLIELSVRIATHSLLTWESMDGGSYFVVDPLVGRLPRPGLSVRHKNGFMVSIGDHSIRLNGGAAAAAARPLTLVVGDSFAFGDGVDDENSWPAILERLSGGTVINAAVPGFGLDQALLRGEQLAEVYAPDLIVVSFIPHDVLRCEMSYWSGHSKPYFDVASGSLHLNAAPGAAHPTLDGLKSLLTWSIALDRFYPQFFWEGPEELVVHHQGREVACLLMQRLAALGRARHARVVVLAQPQEPTATTEQLELKDGVLDCARAQQLPVLDLFPVIEHLPFEQRVALFPRHMSAEGNRLVATELAAFLARTFPPQGGSPGAGATAQ
jgi:hypothetical protein